MTFEFSRRGLLAAIGIASAPATAVAAIATAPAVASELSELLAIGKQLDQLEADLVIAERDRAAAIAHYDATKPTLPSDLVCPEFLHHRLNPDVRLAERFWCPVHDTQSRVVQFHSRRLKDELARLPKRSRSARAKWLRHRLALAEAYENASDDAWHEYAERVAEYHRITASATDIAEQVATIEPTTFEGVAIKARALIAAARVGPGYTKTWAAQHIGPGLAADIVRLTNKP